MDTIYIRVGLPVILILIITVIVLWPYSKTGNSQITGLKTDDNTLRGFNYSYTGDPNNIGSDDIFIGRQSTKLNDETFKSACGGPK